MNRFFINKPAKDINNLDDKDDIKHITKVLRLEKDDLIEIVDSNSNEYIMKINRIEKDFIELLNIEKININRETSCKIILYQGIPKGQKMDLICQKATEIGVFKIIPVKFERCISDDINKNKQQRLNKIMQEAAKQSKRQIIPQLDTPLTFKEMLEDLRKNDANVLFYENENNLTIKDFMKKNIENYKSIGVIIGPEGGISDNEISILKNENINILTLGNRILRTETAGLVASSILIYELENRN